MWSKRDNSNLNIEQETTKPESWWCPEIIVLYLLQNDIPSFVLFQLFPKEMKDFKCIKQSLTKKHNFVWKIGNT